RELGHLCLLSHDPARALDRVLRGGPATQSQAALRLPYGVLPHGLKIDSVVATSRISRPPAACTTRCTFSWSELAAASASGVKPARRPTLPRMCMTRIAAPMIARASFVAIQ